MSRELCSMHLIITGETHLNTCADHTQITSHTLRASKNYCSLYWERRWIYAKFKSCTLPVPSVLLPPCQAAAVYMQLVCLLLYVHTCVHRSQVISGTDQGGRDRVASPPALPNLIMTAKFINKKSVKQWLTDILIKVPSVSSDCSYTRINLGEPKFQTFFLGE